MESVLKLVEAALAIFGAMKFLHELYELLHHAAKLVQKMAK